MDDLDALTYWIDRACEAGAVPVVTGANGDMDTVGSAVALARVGRRCACGVHLGRLAKRVLNDLNAPFQRLDPRHPMWPRRIGGIIIVDAAAPDQLGIQLPDAPRCDRPPCDTRLGARTEITDWFGPFVRRRNSSTYG